MANFIETSLPGVIIIEPKVFKDARGLFFEMYRENEYQEAGITGSFVQENHSHSTKGVLRGLHYQLKHPQGKLFTVLRGELFDVVVDIRVGSPTFGRSMTVLLSADNHRQLYIPPGYAHGCCAISDVVDLVYKATDYYQPTDEYGIAWNDPILAIDWPVASPLLSPKDASYVYLQDQAAALLPRYTG